MKERHVDVCVVGGGLTGLMTAKAALAAGRSVLVIERGGEYQPDETNRRTWWKEQVRDQGVGDDGYHHYRNSFEDDSQYFDDLVQSESGAPPWSFKYNMWYGVGGAGQMWSGMAWRLTPEDFRTRSHGGYGTDWPITYQDLASFYGRAEQFLEVSGPPPDVRKGLKYWPWDNDFAYDHFPLSYLDKRFQETLGDVGELVPQPHAVRNKPIEEGGCIGAKTCVSFCGSRAIFKANERILPDIILESDFDMLIETAVTRIDWDGEARKVNYVECASVDDPEPLRVTADTFFLAGNAFENIRLIKHSEAQNKTPFGASSALVGKYFSSHAAVTYTAVMDEPVYPVRGRPTHASVIEWVKREASAGFGGITMEVWDSDFTLGYAPWRHFRNHADAGHWGSHLFDLLDTFERRFAVSMIFETEMTAQKQLTLSPTSVDRFGIPVGRVDLGLSEFDQRTLARLEDLSGQVAEGPGLTSYTENGRGINGNHPLGGLRMSESSETGVVNDRCRSHDFDNLYILGGGAFCSTGSFNPTLTITALAIRAFEDPELGWDNAPF